MKISDNIFRILRETGMSQKEFSQKTGISQSTISDWKGKKLNPSADKILIICDALNVTPYELLGGTEAGKYEMPDHIVVEKNSDEYTLVQQFRRLKESKKNRLLGYIQAMQDL